jgi:hypothetical protein
MAVLQILAIAVTDSALIEIFYETALIMSEDVV